MIFYNLLYTEFSPLSPLFIKKFFEKNFYSESGSRKDFKKSLLKSENIFVISNNNYALILEIFSRA